jgi:hypothetical protein
MITVPIGIFFMIKNWRLEEKKSARVFNVLMVAFSLIFALILFGWEFWR